MRLAFLRREILTAAQDEDVLKKAGSNDIVILKDDAECEPDASYIAFALEPRNKTSLASLLSTGRALSTTDDPLEGMKSLSRRNSRSSTATRGTRGTRGAASRPTSAAPTRVQGSAGVLDAAADTAADGDGADGGERQQRLVRVNSTDTTGSVRSLTRLDTMSEFQSLGIGGDTPAHIRRGKPAPSEYSPTVNAADSAGTMLGTERAVLLPEIGSLASVGGGAASPNRPPGLVIGDARTGDDFVPDYASGMQRAVY